MKITISYDNISKAVVWCQQRFKKDSWNVHTNWPGTGWTITVPDNEMGTLFALKWGS